MINLDELEGKVARKQGVDDIAQVRIARLESDGTLSVFKKQDPGGLPPPENASSKANPDRH
jgi:uncharacterized membrane protein YcaP (DUF421 family)